MKSAIGSRKPDALACVICCIALAFSLFTDFIPLPVEEYSAKRIVLLCLLIFCVVLSLICIPFLGSRTSAWMLKDSIVLLSIWVLLLANLFFFSESMFALSEIVMYGAFFSSFVLCGHMLHSYSYVERSWNIFITVAVIACFFYALMTINVYLFAVIDGQTNLVPYIPWGFVSMRYWSHLATWLLPLLPLALLIGSLKTYALWRFAVFIAMFVWWWIVLLSSARGTSLGIIFGLLLVVFLFGKSSLPWLKLLIQGFIGGLVLWIALSLLLPELLFGDAQIRGIKTDNSDRIPQLIESWQMSMKNFPFGMGAQSWLTHDIISPQYAETKKFGHPHNMYMLWAAEYGWLLLALVVILVVSGGIRFFQMRRLCLDSEQGDTALFQLVAGTASVSAALFHAGVSAVFMAPASMLIGVLVLTLFWGRIHSRSFQPILAREPGIRELKFFACGASLLTFVFLGIFWIGNVFHYYEAMKSDISYYQSHAYEGHLPRFWFHGYFPRNPSAMPENP